MTDTVGTTSDTSPEALLKQAVMGARTNVDATTAATPGPAVAATPWMRRLDPRLAGVAGAALVLGGLIGAGATRLSATDDARGATALAEIQQRLGSAQAETEHLNLALGEIGKKLAHAQESVDASRVEARTRNAATLERIARAEQALAVKVGALSERFEQMEKDQAGRVAALTAQIDKRLTPPAPAPVAAKAAPEPTETGAIAHAAPKPATDNWAVREVYDGVAVLEDRKRRLVEVGIGDTIPGIGRVDTIERRGRTWAVVTRQGVITAQTW